MDSLVVKNWNILFSVTMNFWHFFRNVNIEKISNVALICMLVNTTCLSIDSKGLHPTPDVQESEAKIYM